MKAIFYLPLIMLSFSGLAQKRTIEGVVRDAQTQLPLGHCSVQLWPSTEATIADEKGKFRIPVPLHESNPKLLVSFLGYKNDTINVQPEKSHYVVLLQSLHGALQEVVVTGTMKEMTRLESPVPVEVYTPAFFRKNPAPSLFESIGMVNGVQPQLNCNVCNTGDIHINGMEGAYTLILIDGMPIVSSLSTVYGLSGIPNSLIERLEVVKGPAASLYGSEAMGGIINVITKSPAKAPLVSVDVFTTSWQEHSVDVAVKSKVGKAYSLFGVNYFNYQQPLDHNQDGFTDVTQQHRVSLFNKWSLDRKQNRMASLAGRYVYEDRWGGQLGWNRELRGSDSLYAESVYTKRWELIGQYQLPMQERVMTQFSYNWHQQNSMYGLTPYLANQQVLFGQVYWDKALSPAHNLLLGASFRYTYYDDNTPATAAADSVHFRNQPMKTPLPGAFVQDEWSLSEKHTLLLGYRYDYDRHHGSIHSPRIAYKWSPQASHTVRASFGTGFRVVNLFTEDHAALTGAREVVIQEELKPEKSLNGNLNYVLQIPSDALFLTLDATGFYSYFRNKIIGDFDTDPNKILYDNLRGHAVSRGFSLNADLSFQNPFKLMAGVTYLNVYQKEAASGEDMKKTVALHAPKWSGTFQASYTFPAQVTLDLTGTWSGPMRLPILPNDYRPEYSPWYSLSNLQVTKKFIYGLELYAGVKNLFNFVPEDPILRAFDPFDKNVNDPVSNPYGYTFDPNYNYASLQGRRFYGGLRFNLYEGTGKN